MKCKVRVLELESKSTIQISDKIYSTFPLEIFLAYLFSLFSVFIQ